MMSASQPARHAEPSGHASARSEAGARPSRFEPGRNCYRVAHADRVALLIDGENYFSAFAEAALRAQRSIVILGWDFHSRTRLHLGRTDVPDLLGDFLNELVRRRRELHVYVLIWDYPVLFAAGRELSPVYGLSWHPRRRVHVHYDDHYPIGAAQHQKIVLIDGVLAFCGGLDLTRSRWDTREHKPGDERRINVGDDEPYPPFHDTMMAVDADAARVLSEVAQERWRRATGRNLNIPPVNSDPWPESMPVALTDVDVAIARTMAPIGKYPGVNEIEQLYLDMIRAAKRVIYIENQYFTSNTLGDALAQRLAEPDAPEVIAVLRLSTEGWLEAPTMGTLRTVLLRKLRDADRHGRFHAYYPHIPGLPEGQCCDLHSKLMIVDDEMLRIGSANFCNRSMGLDTECDLAIEARGDPRIARAIRDFRQALLSEHLDVPAEHIERTEREVGSLHGAIEALQTEGRTLRKYERLDEPSEALLAVAEVADPEKPVSLARLTQELKPDSFEGGRWPRWSLVMMAVMLIAALAAVWRFGPLAAWADAARVTQWAEAFSEMWWAPLVVLGIYTPASIVLFPRPLITLFAVLAFGSLAGFAYAFAGILLAGIVTYYVGRRLDRGKVRAIAGQRVNQISMLLRHRGLLAMTAARFVPLAPYAVVNVVAGAIHVRPRHFILGTGIGILPGTLVATVFGDQLAAAFRDPSSINYVLIAAVALLALGVSWMFRRWVFISKPQDDARSPQRT